MKFTKTVLASAVIAASGFAATAQAEDDAVTMNIGVTSNYVWRGVTQSSDAASVSGGLDYAHESGLYIGTWIGSLGDSEDGGFPGAETDFYIGYGGEAGSMTYDVGYVLYYYSDIQDGNFGEAYGSLGFGDFSVGLNYTAYSQADDDATFGEGGLHVSASYGFALSEEIGLSATVGTYDFDTPNSTDNYEYAQVDVAKGDFTLSISKVFADEVEGSPVWDEDTKFVISWGSSF
jgi:uncharacterized protein (TIGR02001 family)